MDEISQRAIDKIDRELMDFMEQVLEENQKNTAPVANNGNDKQPQIIPNYKPPKRSLRSRITQPYTIIQRADRMAIALALLSLGGLIGLKQIETAELEQQLAEIKQQQPDDKTEYTRPAKFDLYDRVEIPPRSHSL